MKRNLFTLLLALLLPVLAFAQDYMAPQMAYVNAKSVNVRQKADRNSKKIGSLSIYSVVELKGNKNANADWLKCSFWNDEGNYVEGYVSAQYLTVLADDPVSKSMLNGKQIDLLESAASDLTGSLTFTFKGNNFKGDYTIWSKELRRSGGSGTVDMAEFEGVLNSDGSLSIFEWDLPVRYDAQHNILLLLGYLWNLK